MQNIYICSQQFASWAGGEFVAYWAFGNSRLSAKSEHFRRPLFSHRLIPFKHDCDQISHARLCRASFSLTTPRPSTCSGVFGEPTCDIDERDISTIIEFPSEHGVHYYQWWCPLYASVLFSFRLPPVTSTARSSCYRIRAVAVIGSACGLGASPAPDLRESARAVPHTRKYRWAARLGCNGAQWPPGVRQQ
jgi:hypothetical protein